MKFVIDTDFEDVEFIIDDGKKNFDAQIFNLNPDMILNRIKNTGKYGPQDICSDIISSSQTILIFDVKDKFIIDYLRQNGIPLISIIDITKPVKPSSEINHVYIGYNSLTNDKDGILEKLHNLYLDFTIKNLNLTPLEVISLLKNSKK